MIKAVLFDMDGLMIDSESIQSKSFEEIIKEYGKQPIYNDQGIVQTVGISARDNWLQLAQTYSLNEDIDVLIEKKRQVYESLLLKNLSPMPGLINLLNHLANYPVKKAVVSSSAKRNIDIVVNQLGITQHFDTFVSGEQVKHGKPAPDIFLEAANLLHVEPSNCLVLEDAVTGVQSAKSAGMKVIAVPNKFTAHQDFSAANKIISSLKDINWETISSAEKRD